MRWCSGQEAKRARIGCDAFSCEGCSCVVVVRRERAGGALYHRGISHTEHFPGNKPPVVVAWPSGRKKINYPFRRAPLLSPHVIYGSRWVMAYV